MPKTILIISGSPRKDGNTAALIEWFAEGARRKGACVETVNAAFLKYRSNGCTSCRACQALPAYECVIADEAQAVLKRMAAVDTIVMATPLYFWAASAQLKMIIDRMFSLYKWNNETNTVQTPLKGKALILIASSYDPEGLELLEAPFKATADYTCMRYDSFLVPGAGVSGTLRSMPAIREKTVAFGERSA